MFSLSCPSEPPGVGIWFSSYEYRSPDPDSNFSPHDSVFGEKEFRRDEEEEEEEKVRVRGDGVPGEKVVQCNRTCVIEDDHNEDLCLTKNQNLQPFSSCSLFSEPPDIRNWFSSYVYESPESDTGSLFRDEVSEEKEVLDFEVVKNESRSENVNSKRCVDINTSSSKNPKGDDGTKMKKNSSTADSLHPEKTLQPFVQNKTPQHNPSPSNYNETLSLNHESPGCVQEGHLISFDTDRSAMRPPNLAEKNGTRESKSKTEIQNDKLDSSTSSPCSSNKENDGFVTTRKNSSTCSNDENSWKKPEKIILKCSTSVGKSSITCEKDGVTKRKALAEATNLEQYNVVGITGKWQCPQKRKPDVGPAMKQLRLERWVRRI
ncbi:hypothetical protein Fmac_002191 [Flemingia macrophylla]|uniref:Uncharacterized protein n=1 Tax=Flemingia macrophylla TaxID=520843 RepID=A0ABD1NJ77_9FABA